MSRPVSPSDILPPGSRLRSAAAFHAAARAACEYSMLALDRDPHPHPAVVVHVLTSVFAGSPRSSKINGAEE